MKKMYIFLIIFLVLWGILIYHVMIVKGDPDPIPTHLQEERSSAVKPALIVPSSPAASPVTVTRVAGLSLLRHSGVSSSASPAFGTHYQGSAPSSGYRLYTTSPRSLQSVGGGGGGGVSTGNTGSTSHGVSNPSYSFSSVSAPIAMATSTSPYRSPVFLAAREVQGGVTADQTYARISPRRVIINDGNEENGYGDENLHPTNPPADPYFTPVGENPWWFILALVAFYAVMRKKTRLFLVNNFVD